MIYQSVLLWFAATALLCGLTALVIGRRTRHAEAIFRHLPEPIMRVSTRHLRPVVCNQSFCDALGYANPAECCRLFNHYPHLPEDNLYQIWHSNRLLSTRTIYTRLNDRQGQPVGNELRLQLSDDRKMLDIFIIRPVRTDTLAELLMTQRAIPYLQMDADLRVRRCNQPATERFALGPGDRLQERAFPETVRVRLTNIYRRRLSRHGRLHLHHRTQVTDGAVEGTWWIAGQSPDTYHVLFREDQGVELALGSPLFELQDDVVGFWEVDLGQGQITHNKSWLEHLGHGDLEVATRLDFWLSFISPLDRNQVRHTIETANNPFSMAYQMANGAAVQIQVETRGLVSERDHQGRPLRLQGIHINRSRDPGADTQRENAGMASLERMAANLGFTVASDPATSANLPLPFDAPQLERILSALTDFLVSEFGEETERTVTAPTMEQMWCSSCSDNASLPVSITVRCHGVKLPSSMGRHLLAPGFSLSRLNPGNDNSLYRINRQIHDRGGHLGISLAEGFTVFISLPAQVTQHGSIEAGVRTDASG